MAAPMELYCWAGGWGLPTVDPDCLAVLTYARFTGAPLKVHKITNPWRSPSGSLPALKTSNGVFSDTQEIITHFRKQQFNADYDLSALQAADTLAFLSLVHRKLLPMLIHTFWVDAKNYVEHTRKWYAEAIPFPLNFFLPSRMQKRKLEHLQTVCGESWQDDEEQLEKQVRKDVRGRPASLDASVFSLLAGLLHAKLPNGKFQQHLKSLPNLCNFCTSILSLYFPWDGGDPPPIVPKLASGDGSDGEEETHKRRNQFLSVLVALVAMVGYAFLTGIVSIQKESPHQAGPHAITLDEVEEEEEEEE
ncbi:metaxin-1 [Protobothrops mucrosquamatus]|uniref:metaxin-1 n=1 Tax=Protobothrops mucrosquamatus TaxID=103944 RepID=UPI0007755E0B|nr:metaxin-1 [Protobothrops mucrosquamatus]